MVFGKRPLAESRENLNEPQDGLIEAEPEEAQLVFLRDGAAG
jgi:hypothetical protein